MKSKKKLIYKLHQNMQQNPFKQIQTVSYRNVGVRSYDFNKLKSIKAISLKGNINDSNKMNQDWKKTLDLKLNIALMKDQIQHQTLICNKKKITVDKNIINVQQKKLNMRNGLNKSKQFSGNQRSIDKQRKTDQQIKMDRQRAIDKLNQLNNLSTNLINAINISPKNINPYPQQNLGYIQYIKSQQNMIQQYQSKSPTNSPSKNYPYNNCNLSNNKDALNLNNSNFQTHSRHISLPSINNPKQQASINNAKQQPSIINKKQQISIGSYNPKQKFNSYIQQQKARQQILKQIKINSQQKINKQVLMSIKLKSIQNLQRIARSRSEVIKIDKWKEKYGQKNNNKQIQKNKQMSLMKNQIITKRQKQAYSKLFLPSIVDNKNSPKQETQQSQYITKYNQKNNRYFNINQSQQQNNYRSQIQLAKTSLFNLQHNKYNSNQYNQNDQQQQQQKQQKQQQVQMLYSDNNQDLIQQYDSFNRSNVYQQNDYTNVNQHNINMNNLNQYYSTQIVKQRSKQKDKQLQCQFGLTQPLKINITQMKKHQRNNKPNNNIQSAANNLQSQLNPYQTIKNKTKYHLLNPYDNHTIKVNHKKQNKLTLNKQTNYNQINNQTNKSNKPKQVQQPDQLPVSPFIKSKSKLYLSLSKNKQQQQQSYRISSPVTFNKQKNIKKIKINSQNINQQSNKFDKSNTILDKIIYDGVPQQWQNHKLIDYQQLQFDHFVQNQTQLLYQQ